MRIRGFLRDYGAGILLLGFLAVTTSAYWHQSYAYTRHEAAQECELLKAEAPEAECPSWEDQDQRTHFWNGVWENDRSEYEQLALQFLLLVALADWLARKGEKKLDAVKAQQEEILELLRSRRG